MSTDFIQRNGRRFLREVPNYPLPVDLTELHRQSLRTSLLLEVLGRPFSSRFLKPPERILEMICGPAVWSLKCDRYLKQMGCHNVRFTGLDVAPLAPDLSRFGVNWQFIQHIYENRQCRLEKANSISSWSTTEPQSCHLGKMFGPIRSRP